jgi:TonB family protein
MPFAQISRRSARRIATATLISIAVAAAVFAPTARAQFSATRPPQAAPHAQPGPTAPPVQVVPFSTLVQQVASAFAQSKAKKVMILDFIGSDPITLDRVGQQIAADFRAQLGEAAHKFTVGDRATMLGFMNAEGVTQDDMAYEKAAAYIFRDAKIDAWAMGTLTPLRDTLELKLTLYAKKNAEQLTAYETSLPFTPDLKAMVDRKPAAFSPDPTIATGGAHGYSIVSCQYCPAPEYSKAAVAAHLQGTVMMTVVVGPDGRITDPVIVRGLPLGLNQQAIECVERWQMKPSIGPDGQPAAVRQTIEVSFHLY